MLRAFSYPNYRLFFGGQIVSLIGSWISMTATSWLVYRLTGSAMALGVVGFAGQIPGFIMGPFAGAYLDRWDRHRVLVVTQTISMLQSFALAVLTFTGHITVPAIIVLNAVQGMVNAFDMPARQAFLTTMISDREDLANAIALNSSMFNAARLVGPSIAGLMIATAGESWCFLVDGVSYIAVIIALVAMKDVRRHGPSRSACRHRGAPPRRMAVRVRVPPHPLADPAACMAVPGRHAVLGADAGLRRRDSRRRAVHPWISDGRLRSRRALGRVVADHEEVGRRTGARDPDRTRSCSAAA